MDIFALKKLLNSLTNEQVKELMGVLTPEQRELFHMILVEMKREIGA